MEDNFEKIAEIIFQERGIDISVFDPVFLFKTIEKKMQSAGCSSLNGYIDYLKTDKTESSNLFDALNINFSEFFRNPVTFAYLEQFVLPLMIKNMIRDGEKEIRIWSCACASGQEAYSIAILCDEVIESSKADISCRIFATDINLNELDKARKGEYYFTSLNRACLKHLNKYFLLKDDVYTISPELKKNVDFSFFDLLQNREACPPASIYGNFNIVLCSNILFYYNNEARRRIISTAGDCLAPGGFLITGETEREILLDNKFVEMFSNSAIFQRYK